MGTFETIQRRLATENSRFEVFLDEVDDGQGRRVQDYLVVAPRQRTAKLVIGVAVLPVCDGKIGLLRIFRYPVCRESWEVPRGFIEPGEAEAVSALRELREETGLACEAGNLVSLGHIAPESGIIMGRLALFVARHCQTANNIEPEVGHRGLKFFEVTEVEALIARSEIEDPSTLVTFLRFRAGL